MDTKKQKKIEKLEEQLRKLHYEQWHGNVTKARNTRIDIMMDVICNKLRRLGAL